MPALGGLPPTNSSSATLWLEKLVLHSGVVERDLLDLSSVVAGVDEPDRSATASHDGEGGNRGDEHPRHASWTESPLFRFRARSGRRISVRARATPAIAGARPAALPAP